MLNRKEFLPGAAALPAVSRQGDRLKAWHEADHAGLA